MNIQGSITDALFFFARFAQTLHEAQIVNAVQPLVQLQSGPPQIDRAVHSDRGVRELAPAQTAEQIKQNIPAHRKADGDLFFARELLPQSFDHSRNILAPTRMIRKLRKTMPLARPTVVHPHAGDPQFLAEQSGPAHVITADVAGKTVIKADDSVAFAFVVIADQAIAIGKLDF